MIDFVEVTKAEFYAFIGPLNVTYDAQHDVGFWRDEQNRVVGKKSQGYVPRHGEPVKYFLARATTGDSNG